jgi:hypothetical protein
MIHISFAACMVSASRRRSYLLALDVESFGLFGLSLGQALPEGLITL